MSFFHPLFVGLLRRFRIVLLILAGIPAVTAATTVDAVDQLIDAGAVSLALRVIGEEQPDYASSAIAWQRWESRRLAILELQQRWPEIIERVAAYSSPLADDFWIIAEEAAARAHLASGEPQAASAIIAALIWGTAQDTARVDERSDRLSRWRAMLTDAYLLAGQIPDAETAALRYRLDYGDNPQGWRLAHVKALVREGRNQAAREELIGLDSTEAAYLKLMLRARNISVDPVELLGDMRPLLGEGRLLPAERAQLWAALADSAARYRDHEIAVTAMEQALALDAPIAAWDRFVPAKADALWDAYRAYAASLANESQLLVGRFDAWLDLADQFKASGDPRARALFAYLSLQKRDPRVADRARAGLVSALSREPHGLRILGSLYLESRQYADRSAIPAGVRAPLVAYAVEESRFDLAKRLLAGLDPAARRGLSRQWRAPLAVALIADGKVDEAVALFSDDANDDVRGDPQAIDTNLRVARALQVAGEYAHGAALLSRTLAMARSPAQRRALLFLAAQAEARAGHEARAARLYIQSAAVPDGRPVDAWSRSARLQASRALAGAGLEADAERVLETILVEHIRPDERDFLEHASGRF